jgi:acetyl esterase
VSEELDNEARRLIGELAELELPPLSPEVPDEARETFRSLIRHMNGDRQDDGYPRSVAVSGRLVQGRSGPIPIRVYDPPGHSGQRQHVVVLMHGGGWMVGDLDTHDGSAYAIAARVGARVVSVHYRRAPEHPFPAALEDCIDVVKAISAEPTTRTVSVAGDSAGGNLAAATALSCLYDGGPEITAQLLIYPALDPDRRGGSAARFGEGYLLTLADMATYDGAYLPDAADRKLPLAAPLRATELSGLAPAVIATAGFDPLLDEGREYARRLIAADVMTIYLVFPTLTHGWMDMTQRVPAAASARATVLRIFAALVEARVPKPVGAQACVWAG